MDGRGCGGAGGLSSNHIYPTDFLYFGIWKHRENVVNSVPAHLDYSLALPFVTVLVPTHPAQKLCPKLGSHGSQHASLRAQHDERTSPTSCSWLLRSTCCSACCPLCRPRPSATWATAKTLRTMIEDFVDAAAHDLFEGCIEEFDGLRVSFSEPAVLHERVAACCSVGQNMNQQPAGQSGS